MSETVVTIIIAIVGSGLLDALVLAVANKWLRKAQTKEKEASAARMLVNASHELLEDMREHVKCLEVKVAKLERKNRDLIKRVRELEKCHEERETYVETLKHRIKLLARLLTQVFVSVGEDVTLESLLNGFQVSEEDRAFLDEIVEEVNGQT